MHASNATLACRVDSLDLSFLTKNENDGGVCTLPNQQPAPQATTLTQSVCSPFTDLLFPRPLGLVLSALGASSVQPLGLNTSHIGDNQETLFVWERRGVKEGGREDEIKDFF